MATGQMSSVIQHFRRAALLQDGGGMTDGQLLERFLARRDEAAFEALVRRHGPMVLGVCRRVLHNAHDAEDAFQATFLVLVRKAASLLPREAGRQLAVRGGLPHGPEGAGGDRAAAGQGSAGEGHAQTRSDRRSPLDRLAAVARPGVEPPARQVPGAGRPLRPGGQDPPGSGPATRHPRRDAFGPADDGPEDAGQAAGPPRPGAVGRLVGGGAVPECGLGGRAGAAGGFHGQGRGTACGGRNGGRA